MKPGLTIYRDDAGDWRWRLVAKNGKVSGASTEGYRRRRSVEANLRAVRAGLAQRVRSE